MNNFCPGCGKAMTLDGKCCAECEAVVVTPAASQHTVETAADASLQPGTLSGVKVFLIAFGITVLLCLIEIYSRKLAMLILLPTSLWAAVDSSRITLRRYKTRLAMYPIVLFICSYLLWFVVLPWYLVVRSKIQAGQVEERTDPERIGVGFLVVVLCIVTVLVPLVLVLLWVWSGVNIQAG